MNEGPERDDDLATRFAHRRAGMAAEIERTLGPFDARHLEALVAVPRERFLPEGTPETAVGDSPLALDGSGLATMSAPHAYLLSFRLADLAPGNAVVELGAGSGYGAALASHIVGPRGRVLTFEIDPALGEKARLALATDPNVSVVIADAWSSPPAWRDFGSPTHPLKVLCTFAIRFVPDAWLASLPDGGVLVAPVGRFEKDQRLVRVQRRGEDCITTEHGAVRYVANRSTP